MGAFHRANRRQFEQRLPNLVNCKLGRQQFNRTKSTSHKMNSELRRLLDGDASFSDVRVLAERNFEASDRDLGRMDEDLKSILLLWWMSLEFVGGGVELYLRGETADQHEELVSLMGRIGAVRQRDLLMRLGGLFDGGTVLKDRIERNDRIDGFFSDTEFAWWEEFCDQINAEMESCPEPPAGALLVRYLRGEDEK